MPPFWLSLSPLNCQPGEHIAGICHSVFTAFLSLASTFVLGSGDLLIHGGNPWVIFTCTKESLSKAIIAHNGKILVTKTVYT